MMLDQALWNTTEEVHNEDERGTGDGVPVDCELPHWPYVINASGRAGGEELTSIFLASLISGFGCSIKPAPIKYTGCKDTANPKYRRRDKWKGNEKKGFEISPVFGQLKKKAWVWQKHKTSGGKRNWRDTTEEQGSNEATLGETLINVSLCKLSRS